jgi:hypothetical protein
MKSISAFELCQQFERGDLQLPRWQRPFLWKKSTCKQYLNAAIDGTGKGKRCYRPLGSIVVYRLENSDAQFLSDGRQRLSTFQWGTSNRRKLVGSLSPEEYERILKRVVLVVQTPIYTTHDEAAIDFQRLNAGTPLDARGYLRPWLTKTAQGRWLDTKFTDIVGERMRPLCSDIKPQSSKFQRWVFGLFLKYITKDRVLRLYDAGIATLPQTQETSIEYRLDQWIMVHAEEFDSTRDRFLDWLDAAVAAVTEVRNAIWDGQPVSFSWSALASFLLLEAHREGSGSAITTEDIQRVWREAIRLSRISIEECDRAIEIGTKIYPLPKEGLIRECVLRQNNLAGWNMIGDRLGINILEGRSRRRPTIQGPPGTDASHVEPFSQGGAKVVIEPRGTNRARGARPIKEV